MSVRRRYALECDGPGCASTIPTVEAYVPAARAVAERNGWQIGDSAKPKSRDFCSPQCADLHARVKNIEGESG